MSASGDELGELVAQVDPAMAVVTTSSRQERGGCLIGFHMQCSIDPPRYVIWLSKANHTFRVALHAQHIAVHLLDQSHAGLAELFGTRSGDELDKFERCEWEAGPRGVPLLSQCRHRLVGRRVALLDEGSDHVCIVLEPTDIRTDGELRPLRLSHVRHLEPGHGADERPLPADERAV